LDPQSRIIMRPPHREPTHPGEILLEDFLKPLNLTVEVAADRMVIPVTDLSEIISGTRGVTADTASRLETLTGASAQFWLNLQTALDHYRARQK
jgi:addiction module HigA family antidote